MWETLYKELLFPLNLQKDCSASSFSRFLSLLETHQEEILKTVHKQIGSFYEMLNIENLCIVLGFSNVMNSNTRYIYILDGFLGLPLAMSAQHKSEDLLTGAYLLLDELAPILTRWSKKTLVADDSYDDKFFIAKLWDDYRIKPVIALKKNEETAYFYLFPQKSICVSSNGEVFCHPPAAEEKRKMVYCGFEESRNALKFKCISSYYGLSCKHSACCQASAGLRIPIDFDRRLFSPIPYCSYKFKSLYKKNEVSGIFRQHLDKFKDNVKKYELKKKNLFCLLYQSFLYAYALANFKKSGEF
jgi:hypothetical protein